MARTRQALLRACFGGNGYVRLPDLDHRAEVGSDEYRKGWEVRMVVTDEGELAELRVLLEQAGFRPARPWRKHNRIVQPVYGWKAVEAFWDVNGWPSSD